MYTHLESDSGASGIFEKALTTFEVSGTVSDQVAKRLKLETGIQLTN